MSPSVGVVICVHDGWPYLRQAVESILGQDRPVDHLIVVDDASSDEGADFLAQLSDPRVLVLTNDTRRGPGAAAQRGVEACGCDLIARLDADDVAEPWRIRAEVAYLESHPDAAMVCASARVIDEGGTLTGEYRGAPRPGVLRWELIFRNPVVQSTVMFRTAAFHAVGGYAAVEVAEDFDLWSRFARSGAELGSIADAGVRLRKHAGQVSECRRDEMLDAAVRIACANIEDLIGSPPDARSVRPLVSPRKGCFEDAPGAVESLAGVTRAYLARSRVGSAARREISESALELTREIVATAGLERSASTSALRACLEGAGYSGLATYRGARAVARMLAPAGVISGWRRMRHGGRT